MVAALGAELKRGNEGNRPLAAGYSSEEQAPRMHPPSETRWPTARQPIAAFPKSLELVEQLALRGRREQQHLAPQRHNQYQLATNRAHTQRPLRRESVPSHLVGLLQVHRLGHLLNSVSVFVSVSEARAPERSTR
ncbi:unannotated protein [freshwater metagenome]|uniref:Unannotated protein n=1 Tax=freshwater metagenome TaxID=449393 RepID=A0A6J7UYC8_9ZZZZ